MYLLTISIMGDTCTVHVTIFILLYVINPVMNGFVGE